ncbi:Glyoxalase-like domain [Macleaya cordata]|uniref:Glyoxalase-like domain n=1 Tax=Macleaya cordata TaxID=56857 RepID=A0A200Q4N3_MACCD|nr:Glyoxalase-like domain [Macleaya cordata]
MAAAAVAAGVCIHHIARETPDVERLSKFYEEIFGFERIETPDFGPTTVVWLKLPPAFSLHLIEKNPESKLPESPWSSTAAIADPKNLPRGHHLCFAVSNYDSVLQALKAIFFFSACDKGIETFEKTQPDGKTKQVFFFDPDGNGLEFGNWEAPKL